MKRRIIWGRSRRAQVDSPPPDAEYGRSMPKRAAQLWRWTTQARVRRLSRSPLPVSWSETRFPGTRTLGYLPSLPHTLQAGKLVAHTATRHWQPCRITRNRWGLQSIPSCWAVPCHDRCGHDGASVVAPFACLDRDCSGGGGCFLRGYAWLGKRRRRKDEHGEWTVD